LIVLVLLPPVRTLIRNIYGIALPVWAVVLSMFVLLGIVILIGRLNKPTSIYKSPELEGKFMEMYDAQMEEWPVPFESKFVDTRYGKMHVIISGPEDAPPLFLFHAGMLPSWSWMYNIEDLNEHYRSYAIDAIGEPGKSVLADIDNHTKNGEDIAALYVEISEALGVNQAYVIGASYGGFIGTNYALYAPERVKGLVLIGPMGVTQATGSTMFKQILFLLFPIEPFKEYMTHWALGDNPRVVKFAAEWFGLVLDGVTSAEAMPTTFSAEQLQSVQVPVLLILGEKDNLVGEPQKVKQFARNVPDIQIEVLDSGHGIWIEQCEQVNALIDDFFE
jgi:pimeloyl-ACP methyl ester carboxylesterase